MTPRYSNVLPKALDDYRGGVNAVRDDTNFIDLRSDTVTRPTPAMRQAMADAVVGDDRYGEDPTVRALEDLYAKLVGKEAALYLPSGTMANQVALRSWTSPGDIVVAGKNQHVLQYERNGSARNSSVQINAINDELGVLDPDELASELTLLRYLGHHVSLVCVENTHMPSGGRPWSLNELRSIREASGGVPIHMDGARLFNACEAQQVKPSEYGALVDSVMSCVSKGLGAPVGSLLAGSRDFIDNARVQRQILGGQMRQAGIIAAAGIVALETMRDRLAVDHQRARRIAVALHERYGDKAISLDQVYTNIVVFRHEEPSAFLSYLESHGILAGSIAPTSVRLVTHNDLSDLDIDEAVRVLSSAP